jgi:hypothetical protein
MIPQKFITVPLESFTMKGKLVAEIVIKPEPIEYGIGEKDVGF